jgi:hypothetical protein
MLENGKKARRAFDGIPKGSFPSLASGSCRKPRNTTTTVEGVSVFDGREVRCYECDTPLLAVT